MSFVIGILLKHFIVKRKVMPIWDAKLYFQNYVTDHVILPQRLYHKFKDVFIDPKYYTVKFIQELARKHIDIEPPL